MKFAVMAVLAAMVLGGSIWATRAAGDEPAARKQFVLNPIGQVKKADGRTTIVLEKEFQPALLGLDGWSHAWVFWWFDRNDNPQRRAVLQVHPRGNRDNPLTGVFATRSPSRPNLIALTLCKIVSVKDNVVELERIDAFDGTPVLDIKPYIPGYDSAEATVPEWIKR